MASGGLSAKGKRMSFQELMARNAERKESANKIRILAERQKTWDKADEQAWHQENLHYESLTRRIDAVNATMEPRPLIGRDQPGAFGRGPVHREAFGLQPADDSAVA